MLEFSDISKIYRAREGGLLRRRYRAIHALEHVNMVIPTSKTLAIIGPNGAGKTTICKIAAGMTKPTNGRAVLNGTDITTNVGSVSRDIGVVLGPTLIYYRLTAYNYLKFFAKIYEVKHYDERIMKLTKAIGMDKWLNAYIEEYSMGMKMKISLARALLHDPSFLILDEFTMGLDPLAARDMRQFIMGLGKTVMLTTHNTLEAEKMADAVAFISRGKIVASDTLASLIRRMSNRIRLTISARDTAAAKSTLGADGEIQFHENTNGELEILVREADLPEIIKKLSEHQISKIQTNQPGLEELYTFFTGEKLAINM